MAAPDSARRGVFRRVADAAIGGVRASPETTDAVAFDAIYRSYSPAVFGYLRANGIDDPEAVTHDVFLALLPRMSTIRGGEAGVKTLLFSIAHARVVDHHRHRARTPVMMEYDPDSDNRMSASAEDRVIRSTSDAAALSLLEVLTPEQREVLLLRVIGDLPLERVAGIMQKSVGAVKQLQRRALAVLKQQPAVNEWRAS